MQISLSCTAMSQLQSGFTQTGKEQSSSRGFPSRSKHLLRYSIRKRSHPSSLCCSSWLHVSSSLSLVPSSPAWWGLGIGTAQSYFHLPLRGKHEQHSLSNQDYNPCKTLCWHPHDTLTFIFCSFLFGHLPIIWRMVRKLEFTPDVLLQW